MSGHLKDYSKKYCTWKRIYKPIVSISITISALESIFKIVGLVLPSYHTCQIVDEIACNNTFQVSLKIWHMI